MSRYDMRELRPGLNQLWPTPVMLHDLPEGATTATAEELLLTMDIYNPVGEIGGTNIMDTAGPALARFREEHIVPTFERYMNEAYDDSLENYESFRLKSWLTGTGLNYGMPPHGHAGAHFSAVFYLLAEDRHAGGEIGFIDSRTNACRGYDGKLREQFFNYQHLPKTGQVLVFPSFLYHYVVLYQSKLRLAIPVDLFLDKR